MTDEDGTEIESAGPSMPVMISGLNNVPQAGDKLNEVEDEKTARTFLKNAKWNIARAV